MGLRFHEERRGEASPHHGATCNRHATNPLRLDGSPATLAGAPSVFAMQGACCSPLPHRSERQSEPKPKPAYLSIRALNFYAIIAVRPSQHSLRRSGDQVTGRETTAVGDLEVGEFCAAEIESFWAARMERTTCGDVQRARQFAD